jgi:carboxylesterase
MSDLFHKRSAPKAELLLPFQDLFRESEHQPFTLDGCEPAALLIHGFAGTPAEMRSIGAALHGAGWTVRALLLPGFGADLATLPDRSWTEWVDSIVEAATVLSRAGHRPLLVVGYSLGATLSIVAESALRPQPTGLVLLAPFWWPDRFWSRLLAPVLRSFLARGIRPFQRANLGDPRLRQNLGKFLPGADLDDPDVQRAVREFRVPVSLIEEVIGVSRLAYTQAGAVQSPVLVVQGKRDEVVRGPLTLRLLRRFSGPVEYLEVDSGHALTQPSNPVWPVVSDAILRFADGVRGQRVLQGVETGFVRTWPATRKVGIMSAVPLREQ